MTGNKNNRLILAMWLFLGSVVGITLLASYPEGGLSVAKAAPDDEPGPTEDGDEVPPVPDRKDGIAPVPRKLTDAEVSRIRFMELRAMRGLTGVDRVTVKVPRDVQDDFLVTMTGHEDFRGKKARQGFLKRTPPQKLHIMAHYTGAKYADRVEILTDPELFLEFRKHVLPQAIRGCATSGCHNSKNERAYGFKLFKDPKKVPETTYANFITLNDFIIDGNRMINRNDPSKSLLVTYMLPKSEVPAEFQHPGDVEYRPIFQSHKHPRFQRILRWIGALKIPPEDYGVRLLPEPKIPDPDPDSNDDSNKPKDDDSKDPPKTP
jgi:hypothetical protein